MKWVKGWTFALMLLCVFVAIGIGVGMTGEQTSDQEADLLTITGSGTLSEGVGGSSVAWASLVAIFIVVATLTIFIITKISKKTKRS